MGMLLLWTRGLMILGAAMASCLLLFLISMKRRMPGGLRLPPGPRGRPIVGNVSDIPIHKPWETIAQWSKTYGDLMHIKILHTHIVFVNSVDIAFDLFEKRSSNYSDRFGSPMLIDLMGFDWSFGLMSHDDNWRRHRRMFNQRFRQAAVGAYQDIQTKQTRKFLRALRESPQYFINHLRHLSGAIIMEATYGIQIRPQGDPYIQVAERTAAALAEAGNPGAFLVDTFPILKYVPAWFPGAGFQKKARAWRVPVTEMIVKPFEAVKESLAAGTAKPSIVATLLEDLFAKADSPPDGEKIIRNVAGLAYLGGADTTVSSLTIFILAMVLHPEVQRKAQDELDSVIGMGRLPDFKDRKDLPYVNAVCNEVLRWHPVVPLGVAHQVSQDDVYGDFFIPKGSIVVGNCWAILGDERLYGPETDKFNPERFLDSNFKLPTGAFGFGRRICPGRYFAENSMFIAMASILKAFDITHATDKNGNKILVKEELTSGLLSYPEPFQCDITLRSVMTETVFLSGL